MAKRIIKKILLYSLIWLCICALVIFLAVQTGLASDLAKMIDYSLIDKSFYVEDGQSVETSMVNWGRFKYLFLGSLLLCFLGILVIILLYLRRSIRKEGERLTNEIVEYMTTDSPNNPSFRKNNRVLTLTLDSIKTENQQKEQVYQQEIQNMKDTVSYLAHDLKTPLSSVIGYLNLLVDIQDLPQDKREKYVNIALDKSYRLERLMNELFDLARLELHEIRLTTKNFNVYHLLNQVKEELYPMMRQKNQEILIEEADVELTMLGDSEKIARVVNNLLRNASTYGYENSDIVLSAEKTAIGVKVSVTNAGDSIPPEKLDTIFEKFYRGDESRGTETAGSGLGLTIAKEIVEAHGGRISVASQNGWTNFTFEIPSS